jgi:hypothetical protein
MAGSSSFVKRRALCGGAKSLLRDEHRSRLGTTVEGATIAVAGNRLHFETLAILWWPSCQAAFDAKIAASSVCAAQEKSGEPNRGQHRQIKCHLRLVDNRRADIG